MTFLNVKKKKMYSDRASFPIPQNFCYFWQFLTAEGFRCMINLNPFIPLFMSSTNILVESKSIASC